MKKNQTKKMLEKEFFSCPVNSQESLLTSRTLNVIIVFGNYKLNITMTAGSNTLNTTMTARSNTLNTTIATGHLDSWEKHTECRGGNAVFFINVLPSFRQSVDRPRINRVLCHA